MAIPDSNPLAASDTSTLDNTYFPGIEEIVARLEQEYGSPRLGNKDDPLDELIFIILSTRTLGSVFEGTYERLRSAFPEWNSLTPSQTERVVSILSPAGLGRLKATQIVSILELLREEFGRATLDPLGDMSDEEAEEFLTSLPGVSAKVAKCVMMYSLESTVLPVDVHVHRVATRLGFRTKKRPDTSQDLIEAAVPPRLRYAFHVNSIAHGRAVCVARSPRCQSCCLADLCNYYQRARTISS